MHYNDVIMGAIASQITSLTTVYSIVYSDADQRKQQSSASLAFVRGIHQGPVNSPHKWPVTRKTFQFDDVIMEFKLELQSGNAQLGSKLAIFCPVRSLRPGHTALCGLITDKTHQTVVSRKADDVVRVDVGFKRSNSRFIDLAGRGENRNGIGHGKKF